MRPVTVLAILLVSTATAFAQTIEVAETGWNFGIREQDGGTEEKSIEVRNTGTVALRIRVQSLCGCVSPKTHLMTVPPGGKRNIVLILDTAKGEWDIKKHVELVTNDPNNRKVQLLMEGKIYPGWWLSTKDMQLGKINNGEETRRKFRVFIRKGKKIKITQIFSVTPGLIEFERKPFKEKDGQAGEEITMIIKPGLESGQGFESAVAVRTDFAPLQQRAFRIFGNVTGGVTVSPTALAFGRVKSSATAVKKILVEKAIGVGMKVTEIYCKDPRISSKISELDAGRKAEVEITFTPVDGDKGARSGKLWVVVDEPGQRRYEVSFRALISD